MAVAPTKDTLAERCSTELPDLPEVWHENCGPFLASDQHWATQNSLPSGS
jgi:hypothetical protein